MIPVKNGPLPTPQDHTGMHQSDWW